MKQVFVWIRLPDGDIRFAGELAMTEPAAVNGRYESEFLYADEWLGYSGTFPLDPVSLPLDGATRTFRAELFNPPLAILDDALPDDWGRRVLGAELQRRGLKASPPEVLTAMRGGGTGALIFSEPGMPPQPGDTVQSKSLPALLSAASKFERGLPLTEAAFRFLLEGSSRVGGARPKALVHDERGEWIAKFPGGARDAGHDIVGLEATALAVAVHAGLSVPESHIKSIGSRRVLFVRRFDVTQGNGRLHMVSLRTLCRERAGVYVQNYTDVSYVLRKHSAAPAEDVAMFYRYMAFNAAIGNVDDHLKNFWMLGSSGGYRLAPAFDLVPDTTGRREHTLMFHQGFSCPSRDDVLTMGNTWGVTRPESIVDSVVAAAGSFAAQAGKFKVRGGRKLATVCDDIRSRIARLATG